VSATNFDRVLVSWLEEEAPRRAPDGLMAAVDRDLRRTRPRRGWLADMTERPMHRAGRTVVGSTAATRAVYLAAAALLLAVVAGAIAVGSRLLPPPPPSLPFGPGLNGLIAWDTNARIYVAGPDGKEPRPLIGDLATASSATWSPDGTRLALWAEGSPDALFVVSADGVNRVRVAGDLWISTDKRPAWSPDGRQLVFSTESGPDQFDEDLWIVNADGTGQHRVAGAGTGTPLRRLLPAWSPNGRWISFHGISSSDATEVSHVYVIHPDGTGQHELTMPAGIFWPPGPQWQPTPEVSRLAFGGGAVLPAASIYVYDVDNDQFQVVGDATAGGSSPAWSPDGTRLAWFARVGGADRVSIVTIDTSAPAGTIPTGGIVGPLSWSPDESRLLGSNADKTATIVISADGSGQPTSIPHERSQGNPTWQWIAP
jgi:dipeptidyl aminopeptidase/acylaminoacyl peptidase